MKYKFMILAFYLESDKLFFKIKKKSKNSL